MSFAVPQSAGRARRHASGTQNLPPATADLEFASHPHISDTSTSTTPTLSPPETTPPTTPPQLGYDTPTLYSSGPFAYNGVVFSTPKRARATSLVPSAFSPSLLPIGRTQPAGRSHGYRHSQRHLGLGLGLEITQPIASRSNSAGLERARKRHAVLFLPHERSREELRLSVDGRDALRSSSQKLMEWRRSTVDGRDRISAGRAWDDFTPESPELSVEDLTAAFPSPPVFTPKLTRSLATGFSPDRPPDIPLPPTPPSSSSRFSRASFRSTHSTAVNNRLTVIDPEESLARLKMSMSVLETYSASYDGSFSVEAGGDDSSVYADSEPESDDQRELVDGETELLQLKDNPTWLEPPGDEDFSDGRRSGNAILSLTPTTFARVGFSRASLSTSTPLEEKEVPTDSTLLPKFDFEQSRRSRSDVRNPPLRFSSLITVESRSSVSSSSDASLGLGGDADESPRRSTRQHADKATPFLLRSVRVARPIPTYAPPPVPTALPAVLPSDPPASRTIPVPVPSSRPTTPPPNPANAEPVSFMNLTPEPLPSRMSKLWNRTLAGAGLRKEKSARRL